MIVTEKEASKTLCFHEHFDKCVGPSCMAWRWFDDVSDDGKRIHHKPTAKLARMPERDDGYALSERRGYCGLAGQP